MLGGPREVECRDRLVNGRPSLTHAPAGPAPDRGGDAPGPGAALDTLPAWAGCPGGNEVMPCAAAARVETHMGIAADAAAESYADDGVMRQLTMKVLQRLGGGQQLHWKLLVWPRYCQGAPVAPVRTLNGWRQLPCPASRP